MRLNFLTGTEDKYLTGESCATSFLYSKPHANLNPKSLTLAIGIFFHAITNGFKGWNKGNIFLSKLFDLENFHFSVKLR